MPEDNTPVFLRDDVEEDTILLPRGDSADSDSVHSAKVRGRKNSIIVRPEEEDQDVKIGGFTRFA